MANIPSEEARIFVGTDRSQLLAVKILKHSIVRHTDMRVTVKPMHDIILPEPTDLRQSKRTGFSFTRFAIPELAGYSGRALYLDADMLVFRDIREIYDLPFDGAKVLVQKDMPEAVARQNKRGAPKQRILQCSVMMLDCDALRWDVRQIIAGLDGEYTYEDLMWRLCILSASEIGHAIPFEWNSLETFEAGRTGLLHYTDMSTQPWVSPRNANGNLWLNEIRMMLSEGELTRAEIEAEIGFGYFRPSLLSELDAGAFDRPPSEAEILQLDAIDRAANFQAHLEVMEQQRKRKEAMLAYEAALIGKRRAAVGPAKGLLAAFRRRLAGQ